MNSFDAMGEARLQAAEGQRQLAAAFIHWLGGLAMRFIDAVARHLPEGKATPW